eukprot:jgi/Mesvir1/3755/Mv15029-RA.1
MTCSISVGPSDRLSEALHLNIMASSAVPACLSCAQLRTRGPLGQLKNKRVAEAASKKQPAFLNKLQRKQAGYYPPTCSSNDAGRHEGTQESKRSSDKPSTAFVLSALVTAGLLAPPAANAKLINNSKNGKTTDKQVATPSASSDDVWTVVIDAGGAVRRLDTWRVQAARQLHTHVLHDAHQLRRQFGSLAVVKTLPGGKVAIHPGHLVPWLGVLAAVVATAVTSALLRSLAASLPGGRMVPSTSPKSQTSSSNNSTSSTPSNARLAELRQQKLQHQKQLLQQQQQHEQAARGAFRRLNRPSAWLTSLVVLLLVGTFVAQWATVPPARVEPSLLLPFQPMEAPSTGLDRLLGFLTSQVPSTSTVTRWGLKDNAAIVRGQTHRLITAGLLHGSFLHMAMNAKWIQDYGTRLEHIAGFWATLVVMLASTFAANLFSFAFNKNPSLGASGAAVGLVGALMYGELVDSLQATARGVAAVVEGTMAGPGWCLFSHLSRMVPSTLAYGPMFFSVYAIRCTAGTLTKHSRQLTVGAGGNIVSAQRQGSLLFGYLFVLGVQMAFGMLIPYVDNWAHLGGLLGGIAAAVAVTNAALIWVIVLGLLASIRNWIFPS